MRRSCSPSVAETRPYAGWREQFLVVADAGSAVRSSDSLRVEYHQMLHALVLAKDHHLAVLFNRQLASDLATSGRMIGLLVEQKRRIQSIRMF